MSSLCYSTYTSASSSTGNLPQACSLEQLQDHLNRSSSSLVTLELGSIHDAGMPTALCGMPALKLLDLSHVNLELPSLAKSTNLLMLLISSNAALGETAAGLSIPVSVVYLRLARMEHLQVPRAIGALKHLRVLQLEYLDCLLELQASLFASASHLEFLSLEGCRHLTRIEPIFGNMRRLERLNLQHCRRLPQVPEGFTHLRHLRSLDASQCKCLATPPCDIGGASNLTSLHLTCSKLEVLPASMISLQHLNLLNLYRSPFLISLPDNIAALSSLQRINLDHSSSLLGLPPGFSRLKQLTSLSLQWCTSLSSLCVLSELTGLDELLLRHCHSLSELPDDFQQLQLLTSLGLRHCRSLQHLPDSIGRLARLPEIDLTGCSSLASLVIPVMELTALTRLSTRNCTRLTSLRLSYPSGESGAPGGQVEPPAAEPEQQPGQMTLRILDLSHCAITSLPIGLSLLRNLQVLDLRHLRNLQCWPASMAGLASLRELRLSHAPCQGPFHFVGLSSVTLLEIRHCPAFQHLCADDGLEDLPSLACLSLSGCTSMLALPTSIGKLQHLSWLSLKGCSSLQGLPDSLGSLQSLQKLKLEGCSSLVSLPDTLGHLAVIAAIDLSSCGSLRQLPPSTIHLQSLRELRLDDSGIDQMSPRLTALEGISTLTLSDKLMALKWAEGLPEVWQGRIRSVPPVHSRKCAFICSGEYSWWPPGVHCC